MASAALLRGRTPSPQFDSRRHSAMSSSAASYQTARDSLAPGSHHSISGSSRASSIHTIGPHDVNHESDLGVNPIHIVGHQPNGVYAEGVHIVKVTGDTVHLESGPIMDGFLQKVGHSLARTIPSSSSDVSDSHVGPPPPSPPASIERVDDERILPYPSKMQLSKSEPSRPAALEEPMDDRQHQSARSSFSFARPVPSPSGSKPREMIHRSSTDIKSSSRAAAGSTQRVPRLSHDSGPSLSAEMPSADIFGSQSARIPYHSPDGLLQPPPMSRPARRNTTGSSPHMHHKSSHNTSIHQGYGSQPTADGDVGEELASDIQMQAEQIRRERLSKRAKAQQQAEAALTRTQSFKGEDHVLIGNLIGEDHVNYVLMYNMLTGIRIAVSHNLCITASTR
jgi:1-phosphatidylinositol-4-phosphate 5-kinase